MSVLNVAAASLLVVAGSLVSHVAQAQQAGTHRTELSKNEISIPGWEAVQLRVDIDPGKVAPNHRHPGEEIIYVVEGTIEYQLEGKPAVTLKAGDVLFVPKGVIHSAKNVGQNNAGEIGTYVVPKGKPLVEWIK
jgi:quercetin dioxygenase-like cupin family protein